MSRVWIIGFRRDQVRIEINDLGNQIAVSGEGHRGEKWPLDVDSTTTSVRGPKLQQFKKVFQIPDGVILDDINARYNEEEAYLSIFMPKSRKGALQVVDVSEAQCKKRQIEEDRIRENVRSTDLGTENNCGNNSSSLHEMLVEPGNEDQSAGNQDEMDNAERLIGRVGVKEEENLWTLFMGRLGVVDDPDHHSSSPP